jgi:hypothetical protein
MGSDKDKEIDDIVLIDDDPSETVVEVGNRRSEPKTDNSESRLQQAESELAALRSQIQESRQSYAPQNNQPQIDSLDNEEKALNEREKALGMQFEVDRAAGKMSKDLYEKYSKDAQDIRDAKTRLHTKRAVNEAMPAIANMQQANHYRSMYPDVLSNPNASTYAKGIYQTLLATGEVDSPALVDRAMNEARARFNLGNVNYMKPGNSDKAKYSGISGNGGRQVADNTVRMGKAEKSMALAMYGEATNGDEKKAFKMWASGPGLRAKKLAAKKGHT